MPALARYYDNIFQKIQGFFRFGPGTAIHRRFPVALVHGRARRRGSLRVKMKDFFADSVNIWYLKNTNALALRSFEVFRRVAVRLPET